MKTKQVSRASRTRKTRYVAPTIRKRHRLAEVVAGGAIVAGTAVGDGNIITPTPNGE